jgi:hypothetical protein
MTLFAIGEAIFLVPCQAATTDPIPSFKGHLHSRFLRPFCVLFSVRDCAAASAR